MNFIDQGEMDLLAGEYVLGVLPLADIDEFERELERNHKLAVAVALWHDRLLDVAPEPMAVEPAAGSWERIERDLPRKTIDRQPTRFWNNLFFWRASGLAGVAASIVLAIRLVSLQPEPSEMQYLAVLQAPSQGAAWLVEISSDAVHLRPLAPVTVGAGKSLQFWTKAEGATGPTSLGLVSPDRPTTIPLNRLPSLGQNQLFEVTLEPQAGSPIDRPTGPILAVGKAVRL
ncbi:anti-sigma factor [Noviherbaspirillum cavernae]|nr:anti-sigma factor [Noviherbaspirillum cavernae]